MARPEKEVIQEMIDNNTEKLYSMKAMEHFLMQKEISNLSGKQDTRLALGATQRQVRDVEDIIKFLKVYIKDLK